MVERAQRERARKLVALLESVADSISRALPWIDRSDPWAIYVSEVMLQQTQVSRVEQPWRNFLKAFPTPRDCASASLAQVLVAWQGLGFARRARFLHEASKIMVRDFDGKVPSTVAHLRSLPGIGEYSAASIASFAFKAPVIVLDTNVGRVFSRCVAGKRLSDLELRELSAGLAVMSNSAVVNQRLLDFGAKYCRATPQCEECPAKKFCAWQRVGGDDPAKNSSKVSKPQSAFAGSRRQVRGKILKALGEGPTSIAALQARISDERCLEVLDELVGEGLVEKFKRSVRLHGDER